MVQVWFWLTHNFILPGGLPTDSAVELAFTYLPTSTKVFISCTVDGSFSVASDRLDLCSELIQNLAVSLNLNQLAAEVRMNEEQLKQLMNLFQQAKDLQNSRQRLTADIADQVILLGYFPRFKLI